MEAARPRRLTALQGGAAAVVTDEDLLAAVARGDQTAFAEFYDRSAVLVYGLVERVVRDPARSEEVAQEVMLELWRTASRFDPLRGSAQTWLLTVAHRRAIGRVRSERARRHRGDRTGQRDRRRAVDEVAEQVELRLGHRPVREALATLTDLQREAVQLAYYGGYTYRQVAELLDTPLGTIRTRMRDGLIRLRDALGVTR